jgi:HK97 family phage major capsid protein
VAEGALKPVLAATYAEATSKIFTVAVTIKVSKQSFMDVPLLNPWLDVRLSYSCNLREESVFLNGDATSNTQGLLQVAPAFSYTPTASDNGMDVVARAIGQLMAQGYAVDGVVLNPNDYTAMRLLKSTIGSYIFMGSGGTGPDDENIWEATPLIWQVPLVLSPVMPQGTFLVGAFAQAAQIFSREVLNVQIAFQNEDDFVRNLIALRAELRSGLAIPVPAGLLQGTLPAGSLATTQTVTAPAPAHEHAHVHTGAQTVSSKK